MKVVVTGGSGLIGSALIPSLSGNGHQVVQLRHGVSWDVGRGYVDQSLLDGAEAVVHLAGEPIGKRRWSSAQRDRILSSRADGTRLIAKALGNLEPSPLVMVSASAVGWYGSRGDEVLTEQSSHGKGFLAEVCRQWEDATSPAAEAGVRVVNLRIGIVQHRSGGTLARLLPLFKLGLGGRLGNGRQYIPWISRDDTVRAIEHTMATSDLSGPVNATGPEPVTNREYSARIASALSRPAVFAVPRPALSLLLGNEMASETALASQRAMPARLLEAGFRFRHVDLPAALGAALHQ